MALRGSLEGPQAPLTQLPGPCTRKAREPRRKDLSKLRHILEADVEAS